MGFGFIKIKKTIRKNKNILYLIFKNSIKSSNQIILIYSKKMN